MEDEILGKLFRVQATIEHVLATHRIEKMEQSFLSQALLLQQEAIKLVFGIKFKTKKIKKERHQIVKRRKL